MPAGLHSRWSLVPSWAKSSANTNNLLPIGRHDAVDETWWDDENAWGFYICSLNDQAGALQAFRTHQQPSKYFFQHFPARRLVRMICLIMMHQTRQVAHTNPTLTVGKQMDAAVEIWIHVVFAHAWKAVEKP